MNISKQQPAEFRPIVFSRVIWAAFYASFAFPHLSIYWNGRRLSHTAAQYAAAALYARGSISYIGLGSTQPLIVSGGACNGDAIIYVAPNAKRVVASVINGLFVSDGNHLSFIFANIKAETKAQVAKQLQSRAEKLTGVFRSVSGRMSLIILWRAIGVHWSSQSKDCARFRTADLRALQLEPDFLAQACEPLVAAIVARLEGVGATRRIAKSKIEIDKYTPARYAGARGRMCNCRLFLVEGDSAKSQVCEGISRVLNFDYYGVLSLRGVIPNVRKGVGNPQTRSKKLIDNKFMNTIVQVLGLSFGQTYATEKERSTLYYGGVIGCVDQDLDGVGNIFSLLLNLFHHFWPAWSIRDSFSGSQPQLFVHIRNLEGKQQAAIVYLNFTATKSFARGLYKTDRKFTNI